MLPFNIGPWSLKRKWPPRWTTTQNTSTTGAPSPETLCLVPVTISSYPDFQASPSAIPLMSRML
eukprot:1157432-Pelagomonas_calceolata.AAC.1